MPQAELEGQVVEVLMLAFLEEAVVFDNLVALVVREALILVGLDSLYTKRHNGIIRTQEDPSLADNQWQQDLKHTKDPKTELRRANDPVP